MKSLGHLCVDQLDLDPGQEWLDESETWRFIRLRLGSVYWLDLSKPRALEPGELLIAAPGVRCLLRASQLSKASIDWFVFDPKLLCGFFTVHERRLLEQRGCETLEPIQFLPSTDPIAQLMAAALEQCPRQHHMVERGEALLLGLRVLDRLLPNTVADLNTETPAQDRFEQIVSHMPDMELIQHSAEDLARLCGCTTRHFNRLFRARFGESPRARQTELRLLKARNLLDCSHDKVVQIANDCGYRSLSLFNSLFKRRFGMTPSEWRQKALGPTGRQNPAQG
jgi:AraC-like DNA-binding protein